MAETKKRGAKESQNTNKRLCDPLNLLADPFPFPTVEGPYNTLFFIGGLTIYTRKNFGSSFIAIMDLVFRLGSHI